MKPRIYLKEGVRPDSLLYLHPYLLKILAWAEMWCFKNSVLLVLTSTTDDSVSLNRVSDTHQEGRAVDVSLMAMYGWTDELRDTFEHEISMRFSNIGATGKESHTPVPILRHNNGNGDHFHIQVRPDYQMILV